MDDPPKAPPGYEPVFPPDSPLAAPDLGDVAGAQLAALRDQLERVSAERDRLAEIRTLIDARDKALIELARANVQVYSLAEENTKLRAQARGEPNVERIEGFSPNEPGTPHDGLPTCEQDGCRLPAVFAYTWPDTGVRYAGCNEHAQRAVNTVMMMGRTLELVPLQA